MTVRKTNFVPLSPLCLMQSISLTLDLLSDGNAAAQANSTQLCPVCFCAQVTCPHLCP